ncbi:LuxR C-terminal-related transcriptional regulator [Streptomyces sp. NPDC087300]|uniref:helix-turn-helix transcriptional regulator n=1 Tax=Streptomyces sp. NPDC087300 TaxID=3365780 RepID=UPI00380E4A37
MGSSVTREVAKHLYGQALGETDWRLEQVARDFNVELEFVFQVVRNMEDIGLISSKGGEYRLAGATPEAVLARLIERERAQLVGRMRENETLLKRMDVATASLLEQFQERSATAGTEVIRGVERVSAVLEDATAFATQEIISMHPGNTPPLEMLSAGMRRNKRVLARGVTMRSIHLLSMTRVAYADRHLQGLQDAGVRLRLASTLPFRMILVDGAIAMVPTADADSIQLLLVRDPHVVRLLRGIFDFCWAMAVPRSGPEAPDGDDTELTPQHHAILRLLAAGRTDEGIARQLGISTRTLRRAMSDLMGRLGVSSRFEAGVAAQVRGLLGGG